MCLRPVESCPGEGTASGGEESALRLRCCAVEAEVSTSAAAPSVMGEALPAVTVPSSAPSEKAGLSCWSLSCLNLLGASSLSMTVGACPFLANTSIGTTSCKRPADHHALLTVRPSCS